MKSCTYSQICPFSVILWVLTHQWIRVPSLPQCPCGLLFTPPLTLDTGNHRCVLCPCSCVLPGKLHKWGLWTGLGPCSFGSFTWHSPFESYPRPSLPRWVTTPLHGGVSLSNKINLVFFHFWWLWIKLLSSFIYIYIFLCDHKFT